jgi:hypothetical protein
MINQHLWFRGATLVVGASLLAVTSSLGADVTYDFESGAGDLDIQHNLALEPLRSPGGNPGGYLAVLDPVDSKYTVVRFPDLDGGALIDGFTFSCDVRAGQSAGGRPADGYSVCFANADDPVFSGAGQGGYQNGVAEQGTATGIAICFDTWQGNTFPDGSADIEGIIVRSNGKTILLHPLATRHGACDDITSLQTGLRDATKFPSDWNFGNGGTNPYSDPTELATIREPLCWQPLFVELREGKLTVKWKGSTILDNAVVGAFGSAGRMAFGGRTGGENQCADFDNIKVKTYISTCPALVASSAQANGVTLQLQDTATAFVDPNSVTLKLDGAAVSPINVSKTDPITTIKYDCSPNWLASGSTHHVEVGFNAGAACMAKVAAVDVVVPAYATIPASLKVTGVGAERGFLARSWQVESFQANDNARSERELFGEVGVNVVDETAFTVTPPGALYKYQVEPDYLNHSADGADGQNGLFRSTAADAQRQATELNLWGFPSLSTLSGHATDYIASEALWFVTFANAGYHVWGCNSDDGFRVYAGKNPLDRFQLGSVQLGQYDGGRGADNNNPQTIFGFLVQEAGTYGFRFTWEEGEGGNNLELYEQLADGSLVLLNDTARNAAATKTYRTGPYTDRAFIAKVVPGVGEPVGPAKGLPPNLLEITLVDAATAVVDSSIKLWYNGAAVTPTVSGSGTTTRVSYVPSPALGLDTAGTVKISYDETGGFSRTQEWNFRTRRLAPDDLPSWDQGTFWIEAEDYNHSGGQHVGAADTMPYQTPVYDGLAGVINVDYFDDQNEADGSGVNFTYRTDQRPNHVDVTGNSGGRFGTDRPGPDDMTLDYRIGWVGNYWGNYTRAVPKGLYTAYAALSIDNSDAGGTHARFSKVTAGADTTSQTVVSIGTFVGRGNGSWGSNELAPLLGPTGDTCYFNVDTDLTTFRVNADSGDFDWFVLVKSPNAPPQLRSIEPENLLFSVARDAVIKWNYEDIAATLSTATVALNVNGVAVPGAQLTAVKTGVNTVITYDPPGLFDIGKTYKYELSFNDSSGAVNAKAGSWIANFFPDSPANMFLIEAEDFNTDSGKIQPAVNTMPYLGDAYNGLSAVVNVDYIRSDSEGSGNIYRIGETPNVPMSNDGDRVRASDASGAATWTVDANYRLGWAGGGRSQNYTRNIPSGDYQVWASQSFGETPGNGVERVTGNLFTVTSDPTKPGQTTDTLGYARGPATDGWGRNRLFPIRPNTAFTGDASVLTLAGDTTLRFEYASGDYDYMMLVPVRLNARLEFTSIRLNFDGSITATWTGGGTLQAAPTILGPWQDVPGATSPFTFAPTAPMLYGRVRQ